MSVSGHALLGQKISKSRIVMKLFHPFTSTHEPIGFFTCHDLKTAADYLHLAQLVTSCKFPNKLFAIRYTEQQTQAFQNCIQLMVACYLYNLAISKDAQFDTDENRREMVKLSQKSTELHESMVERMEEFERDAMNEMVRCAKGGKVPESKITSFVSAYVAAACIRDDIAWWQRECSASVGENAAYASRTVASLKGILTVLEKSLKIAFENVQRFSIVTIVEEDAEPGDARDAALSRSSLCTR